MIFNSLPFLVFLFSAFVVYWGACSRTAQMQNVLLLLAGCVFYAWWDYRLLALLLGSAVFSFYMGKALHKEEDDEARRNLLFYTHVGVSVGVLCLYKYFNFFEGLYYRNDPAALHSAFRLLFPLGLSFYTFSNISYVFDIYKGKTEATESLVDYCLFVSFFPKIVSGPIEKAGKFLPQLRQKRVLEYDAGIAALKLIVLGYFKKVVVADSVSPFVDTIFSAPHAYNSPILLWGAILYAFQIYADFSGYSDIAKGVAALFGIQLTANFNYPFFSKDIGDFWRRWHISLSTWLNDYVFNPTAIALRNFGNNGIYIAIVVTFAVSGIWHGEGLTFLVWGLLHAVYYVPVIYRQEMFSGISGNAGNEKLRFADLPKVLFTFLLVVFALIFFRSDNIGSAVAYVSHLFKFDIRHHKTLLSSNTEVIQMAKSIFGILFLTVTDLWCFNGRRLHPAFYYLLLLAILFVGSYSNTLNFIYFKF